MSYPCCDPRLRPPPAQLTEAQMSALSLLLGCPDGATEFALVVHGGVKPEILYDLVSDGLRMPPPLTLPPAAAPANRWR
jgi:hypothetical protein